MSSSSSASANRAGFVAAVVGVVVFHAAVGAVFFSRVSQPDALRRLWLGWFMPALSGMPGGEVASAIFFVGVVVCVVAVVRPRRSLQAAACALLLLGSCMTCGVIGQGV